jgi:hypothetical protein
MYSGHAFWTGVKYAVITDLDVIAAYYHYDQPAYGAPVNCAAAPTPATCHGTFDAVFRRRLAICEEV